MKRFRIREDVGFFRRRQICVAGNHLVTALECSTPIQRRKRPARIRKCRPRLQVPDGNKVFVPPPTRSGLANLTPPRRLARLTRPTVSSGRLRPPEGRDIPTANGNVVGNAPTPLPGRPGLPWESESGSRGMSAPGRCRRHGDCQRDPLANHERPCLPITIGPGIFARYDLHPGVSEHETGGLRSAGAPNA
jgi:hypothetical protein